jgi:hypothetical protein
MHHLMPTTLMLDSLVPTTIPLDDALAPRRLWLRFDLGPYTGHPAAQKSSDSPEVSAPLTASKKAHPHLLLKQHNSPLIDSARHLDVRAPIPHLSSILLTLDHAIQIQG